MCEHEKIVRELRDTLNDPQFERWNTTSLGGILNSVRGYDGDVAHNLASRVAEAFYLWFLGPTNGAWQDVSGPYNPCLFPFPHSTVIRTTIDDAERTYEENKGRVEPPCDLFQ